MKRAKPAGNTSTGLLKLLALALMFCDHAGKMIYGNMVEMRFLGRIAMPLYAWCLVVGACYTRSMRKYVGRMALLFLVSQPIYMVALNHTWSEPNILFTLLLGLCGIWGMQEKKLLSQMWAPFLALCLAVIFDADYGWKGVMLLLLLYGARESRGGIAAVMVAYCLYWGTSSAQLTSLFGLNLDSLRSLPIASLLTPWFRLQAGAILALPLILMHLPGDIKMPKWLGYLVYPLHLVLLIIMEGQKLSGGWSLIYGRLAGQVMNWQGFLQIFDPIVSLFR